MGAESVDPSLSMVLDYTIAHNLHESFNKPSDVKNVFFFIIYSQHHMSLHKRKENLPWRRLKGEKSMSRMLQKNERTLCRLWS